MFNKLEAAEIYHQLLEHRWHLSEAGAVDVSLDQPLVSYLDNVLIDALDEIVAVNDDDD